MRRLTATVLAAACIPCDRCGDQSYAAGRHPNQLCLICEAKARRSQGR